MRTIQAKPLTADAFRQYGTFWSAVDGEGYQVIVFGEFSVDAATQHPVWEFRFEFPKLMSPMLRGSNDKRTLAIRVRSLKLRVTP